MELGRVAWRRFWAKAGDTSAVTSAGFLSDTSGAVPALGRSAPRAHDELTAIPCLGLVGELGSGKSTELARWEESLASGGEATLSLNLGDFRRPELIHQELFQAEEFQAWCRSDSTITLLLDSLDEAMGTEPEVLGWLVRQFTKYDRSRLRLRISCRAAGWTEEIQTRLLGLWGPGAGVYQLLPLRRADVLLAADVWQLPDGEAFLAAIERRGLGPLAARPVTLGLLATIFRAEHDLVDRPADIFERGCALLCHERRQALRDHPVRPALPREQRLAVARRIAVVSILGGRPTIQPDEDAMMPTPTDITLAELAGGEERVGGVSVPIDHDALADTLRTGLFSLHARNRRGWSHAAYPEFLAAQRLLERELPPRDLVSLLTLPDGALIPPLVGVAVWLAPVVPAIFDLLLARDPVALLGADLPRCSDEQRAALVRHLFAVPETRPGWYWSRFSGWTEFWKLGHPALTGQLRERITDATATAESRIVAIAIGVACAASDLVNDLITVALDAGVLQAIRTEAIRATGELGSEVQLARLRPLATDYLADDPDDELKGTALTVLWPGVLSTGELFNTLVTPRPSNRLGAYAGFLLGRLPARLAHGDLPIALAWAARHPRRGVEGLGVSKLVDQIIRLAWEHLDSQGVADGLAAVVVARLRAHELILPEPLPPDLIPEGVSVDRAPSFATLLAKDPGRRHRLFAPLLQMLTGKARDALLFSPAGRELITRADLPWLLLRLRAEGDPDAAHTLALVVVRIADRTDNDQVAAVRRAAETTPALASLLASAPWPDASAVPEANGPSGMGRDEQGSPLPSLGDRLRSALAIASADRPAVRVRATLAAFTPGEADDSLLSAGGYAAARAEWDTLTETDRGAVCAVMQELLNAARPDGEAILGRGRYTGDDLVGELALRFLLRFAPDTLESLPLDIWRAWLPIILTGMHSDSAGEDWEALGERAYRRAPTAFVEVLTRAIYLADRRRRPLPLYNVPALREPPIVDALLALAEDVSLRAASRADLLEALLVRGVPEARDRVATAIVARDTDRRALSFAVRVACAAIRTEDDAGWPLFREAVRDDLAFGRMLAGRMFVEIWEGNRLSLGLNTERDHAAAYDWLARDCPYDPAADTEVGVRSGMALAPQRAYYFRMGILERLRAFGTAEAVDALSGLAQNWPGDASIRNALVTARALADTARWSPPAPDILIAMLGYPAGTPMDGLTPQSFAANIAIISALPVEGVAVRQMLDNRRELHTQNATYDVGTIPAAGGGLHRVVCAVLPDMGNNLAALGGGLILERFPTVGLILMVGIAGGVPNPDDVTKHVRLGDVVVSNRMGVFQYDFGRATREEWQERHAPRPPSRRLTDALRRLEMLALERVFPWEGTFQQAGERLQVARPPASSDVLHATDDPECIVPHPPDPARREGLPRIFTGPIASSNILLKDPAVRDALRHRFGVLAVEMEGSGIADAGWNAERGYFVVRGIVDYCDAHKNDLWHSYAALAAAVIARALLEQVPART